MGSERVPEVGDILARAALGRGQWLGEEHPPYDAIYRGANALIDLLNERGVRYVIAGGLAMRQLGEQRNTDDIDIVLAHEDLATVPELVVAVSDRDFAQAEFAGVRVDILFTRNDVFRTVSERFAVPRRFGSRIAPCATPDGMLILKLYALPSLHRQGETRRLALYEGDIRVLLENNVVDVANAFEVLAPHMLPTDIVGLRTIVEDIQRLIADRRVLD